MQKFASANCKAGQIFANQGIIHVDVRLVGRLKACIVVDYFMQHAIFNLTVPEPISDMMDALNGFS